MDTAQWPQEIVVKPIREEIVTCQKSENLERKIRTKKEEALKCPRCNSTNTKFCYYNNYSLTQPRYFCKTCRRYWTEGGSLRNIPVGGGSRKNKRSSSSSSSSSPSTTSPSINSLNHSSNSNTFSNPNKLPNLVTPDPSSSTTTNSTHPILQNPNHDLNLAFPSSNSIRSFSDLIRLDSNKNFRIPSSSSSTSSSVVSTVGVGVGVGADVSLPVSALELLTGISSTTRGLNSNFVQIGDPNSVYSTTGGFDPLGDLKPISLNFSLDGINNGSGFHEENESGRLLFPFEDLKQVSTSHNNNGENEIIHDHEQKGNSAGYWSGMLGGGGGGGNGSW